jgi:hypothetical protein
MENPSYSCLKPKSLVMTPISCFYCGASDTVSFETIDYLFGLKACALHKAAAIRDCKAYLHEEKMVRFKDVLDHPVIGPFINALKGIQFPVLRSSGEFQDGWTLDMITQSSIRYCDGEWRILVTWKSPYGDTAKDIYKYTPISNMLLKDMVDQVLYCLVDGVYSNEYAEVKELQAEEHADIDGVHHVQYNEGTARILISPITQKEENPSMV